MATTNSFDPHPQTAIRSRHTGQDASAAAIGGEAMAKCVLAGGKGGSIIFPNTTTLGNVEVNNRITAAFQATVKTLDAAGKLADYKVDAGPENIGIDVDANNIVSSIVSLIESPRRRGRHHGRQRLRDAGDRRRRRAAQQWRQGLLLRLRPRAEAARAIRSGALDGALGQQPFLQGFWPVTQLYLQIDRGVSAADLDTKAQLVTKENVDTVGKRFEN